MTECPRCHHIYPPFTDGERELLLKFIFDNEITECVMEGLAIVGWKYKTDDEGTVRPFPVPIDVVRR